MKPVSSYPNSAPATLRLAGEIGSCKAQHCTQRFKWGRGSKHGVLARASDLTSDQSGADVGTYIVTFVSLDPPHRHRWAASLVPTLLNSLLDPKPFIPNILHFLLPCRPAQVRVKLLAGKIVHKLLVASNRQFQTPPSIMTQLSPTDPGFNRPSANI